MNLLRLFGFGRAEPAAPAWSGALDATPIHAWLDAAGIPWRLTRAELAERYGIRPDPAYGWDVLQMPTEHPLLDGLIRPLSAQAFRIISPRGPATQFSAITYFGDDARENVRRTARQLEPTLGRIRLGEPSGNTFGGRWTFGPASVRLTGWPKDLQSGARYTNPAEDRDPRLKSGCHVWIQTGYRLEPTAEERAWLESFVPLMRFQPEWQTKGEAIRNTPGSEHHLQYARMLPEGFDHLIGQMGRSADGKVLILGVGQLYIVPMAEVVAVRFEQLRPARGPGGEWAKLECVDPTLPGETVELGLDGSRINGGTEAVAVQAAEILGRPLVRPPVFDDD